MPTKRLTKEDADWNLERRVFKMTQPIPVETVERLREVKQCYDKDDLLQSNHPATG